MKVLHIPFSFAPDPPGGTEIYVEGLAREQARLGFEAEIAAPGARTETYSHNGLRVHRFEAGTPSLRQIYGEGDPVAATAFAGILDRSAPDIVHLHAFTSAVSGRLVREAKRRGIPVVFTYHTPTVSCQRGTLLRWGKEICEGRLDERACARCTLHGLGLPMPLSWITGGLPAAFGRVLGDLNLSGGPFTALRMTELIGLRHTALRELLTEVDRVVAVCQWVMDLLVRNGVPLRKLSLCRQGLSWDFPEDLGQHTPSSSSRKIALLGRIDPHKGIGVLIEALMAEPSLPLRLDVYGIIQGMDGEALRDKLAHMASTDDRIRFREPLPRANVVPVLRTYDALVVPSQWLESGPLVVYEAFAAGIPVIGSNVGGIAELVEHEHNGLLVEANSVAAWRAALRRITQEAGLLERLRVGLTPPREMVTVAEEMSTLYDELLPKNQVFDTQLDCHQQP